MVQDKNPVSIKVFNGAGIEIKAEILLFLTTDKEMTVPNATPGFYFVRIIDQQGHRFNLKCTVK
jgi:hypothetical protein